MKKKFYAIFQQFAEDSTLGFVNVPLYLNGFHKNGDVLASLSLADARFFNSESELLTFLKIHAKKDMNFETRCIYTPQSLKDTISLQ